MKTLQKIMTSEDDSRLRSLLFDNEETKRRIEIKESENEIEIKRLKDLIKSDGNYEDLVTMIHRSD